MNTGTSIFDDGFHPKNCTTGHDFERWFQGILNIFCFSANLTGGNDNGVDIIATKALKSKIYKFYIQCKFHNRVLGKEAIQQVYAGYHYFGGDGYPVVVTNNRMTHEAQLYARKLGVEIIAESQLKELDNLYSTKKLINDQHKGLMGIMVGCITENLDLALRAVKVYETDSERPQISTKEQLKNEIINQFDEASLCMQESVELQMKAGMYHQKALALQKEALLRNLSCP
ncbi:MAG: restriction endonuclease [Lachnospiraceae bacterium]|nr:restriction endonuclease [Lachnospiraceae bacterium]